MKLIYITAIEQRAYAADISNVDYVMVDLEMIGKNERQGHLDTVISNHCLEDVDRIRNIVKNSMLMVRSNPIHKGIESELNSISSLGADSIMLPMFTSVEDVATFTKIIGDRAEKILLLETPSAVARLDEILKIGGVDALHVGINDLSIACNLKFMFEIVSGGLIDHISNRCHKLGIRFGFGGVGRLNSGLVRSNSILAQHRKYKSEQVILSRDFNTIFKDKSFESGTFEFIDEVAKIRMYLRELDSLDQNELDELNYEFNSSVSSVVNH